MTKHQVLAMLRSEEQNSFKVLPTPPADASHAVCMTAVTRQLYACVEHPPTRHHLFMIRTRMRRDGAVVSHGIFVKERRWWNRYRQVVADRPGAFGE